ncbi:LysE family translocator [Stappia albiluteola]|uniref:LysE family translocator n=1 Tax=Stappia albiluteola TaxID=2758565 RepID=UPI002E2B8D9C|nr:LysE family translocator [Stappia albiluteola]
MPPFSYFLIGLGIGLVTSAPAGPVNLAAIQRTFRFGFPGGFVTGLGAVVADSFYATLAAFGVTAVSDFIELHSGIIQTAGGILVILFGVKVITSHPHIEPNGGETRSRALRNLFTGTFMTLTNPGVVLGFLAIFGSLGKWAPDRGDFATASEIVLGVATGAVVWWAFLCAIVARLRDRMTDEWLEWINRTAGALLIAFGIGIFIHLLWQTEF